MTHLAKMALPVDLALQKLLHAVVTWKMSQLCSMYEALLLKDAYQHDRDCVICMNDPYPLI